MTLAPTTPQPTKSVSNSRSNRLDSLRKAKLTNEQQSKDYVKSNQECRTHIQELMGLLETKQHSLEVTKKQSGGLETQAKKLKDDALMSRNNLDDLKKRESRLVQDRDAAVMAKTRVEQQQNILRQSVHDLDKRLGQEQHRLKRELDQLQRLVGLVTDRNQWMADVMVSNMENETIVRQKWIQQVSVQQQHQNEVAVLFATRIKSEMQLLLEQVAAIGHGDSNRLGAVDTLDLDQKVQQCKADVCGLVHRIQSYSVVAFQ